MSKSELILVTAKHSGFYGSYREPGDVFEIAPSHFSTRWMDKGDTRQAKAPAADLKRAARQEALAAGGANAALETALKDLADAKAEIVERDAKIAELEAKLAEALGPVQDSAPEVEEAAPEEEAPAEPPQAAAPVQRVRRTAAQ